MAGIPDHLIEEVRQRADLVEIVSEHTRLKRAGRTFRGPCPLHGGEGPNFSVDPAKGFYKCFVCGEGGDLFSFLQKQSGLGFLDAVRAMAERYGIALPDPNEQRPPEDPNASLYEVVAFAADWYRRRLWDEAEGRAAREYLEHRGIRREAAERFGLGWAPEAWTPLGDAARKHGIPDALLLAAGLAKEPKHGTTPYDAFRGRVIFPIEDLGSRVVAFGGRILGAAEVHVPKYLNSPESAIYHKGRMLYGLGWSRGAIRKAEAALVVEGYMDYVSLAAHGVPNVVAPLGTAMTEDQAQLLAKYAPRAILLYDSDTAGLRATFRAGDELLRAGVEVLVATLPEGEDPDSLVHAHGGDALRGYLTDAVDVLERKIQLLDRRGFFASIRGTRRAIDALLPTVRATSDEIARGMYLSRIAERAGVPREALEREVEEMPAPVPHTAPKRETRREHTAPPAPAARRMGPERNVVFTLLVDEHRMERATLRLRDTDFANSAYRAVFATLKEIEIEGGRDPDGAWRTRFAPEVQPVVEELCATPLAEYTTAPEEFFEASVQEMLARPFERRLDEIEQAIREADEDEQMRLVNQKSALLDEMRAAGLLGWSQTRRR